MKIKVGDRIRCTRNEDEWLVLSINYTNNDIYIKCLSPGKASYTIGSTAYFNGTYEFWEVLPTKSLNFNSLYDKLNEV